MICLSIDTIDDLILYLRSEDEHVLDFKIDRSEERRVGKEC